MNVSYSLRGLAFEWDDGKARTNADKHGVTFEEAAEVFFDNFARTVDGSVGDEVRSAIIGYSSSQRMLLVVHVERMAATRIISARAATRAERKMYERL
jgi:uncharacterized DUF497 family protein